MSTQELTAEEKLLWANQVYLDMIRRMVRGLEEKYGQEIREIVNKALYEVGLEVGTKLRERLKIEGKEPSDYAKLHYYQDTNLWVIKEEVIPEESGEVMIRATFCPALGLLTAKECALFVPYVRGMMDAINPELKWKAGKVLTRGDDCCEFIVYRE